MSFDFKRAFRAYKPLLILILPFLATSVYGLYKSGLPILNKEGNIVWFSALSYFTLVIIFCFFCILLYWSEPESNNKEKKNSISNKPLLYLTQIGMNNTKQECQLRNVGGKRIDITVLTMIVGGEHQRKRKGESIQPGEFLSIKNIKYETETMYDVQCEVEFIDSADGSFQIITVPLNSKQKPESQISEKILIAKEIQKRIRNTLIQENHLLMKETDRQLFFQASFPYKLSLKKFKDRLCKSADVPEDRVQIEIQGIIQASEGNVHALSIHIFED